MIMIILTTVFALKTRNKEHAIITETNFLNRYYLNKMDTIVSDVTSWYLPRTEIINSCLMLKNL